MKYPKFLWYISVIAFISTSAFAAPNFGKDAPRYDRKEIEEHLLTEVPRWLYDKQLIKALNESNKLEDPELSKADIMHRDRVWKEELRKPGYGPTIKHALNNKISHYLQKIKQQSYGLYYDIAIINSFGFNLGQTNLTDDIWQGDENQWWKPFFAGTTKPYYHNPKENPLYPYIVYVSVPIMQNNQPIGVLTLAIDTLNLKLRHGR